MTSRPRKSPSSKAPPRRKQSTRHPPAPTRRVAAVSTAADFRLSLRPGIERETELMPWLIADSVLTQACALLRLDLPPAWADWLDARAERCYARVPHFRRLVRRQGDGGRDNLYRFFRHWLASRLVRERRVTLRRLPREFVFGGLA